MGAMLRNNFAELLADGLDEIVAQWKEFKMPALEYTQVYNIKTSDQAFEQDIEMAGTPPQVETGESEPVIYEDAIQGGSKRYTHLKYTLGTRVSHELLQDDRYGIVKQVPDAHTRSGQFVREQVAWNAACNNGFTTSSSTTDGLALYSNVHPLLGGTGATGALPLPTAAYTTAGTYPNRPATDIDLSFSAVQTMLNQFKRLVDGVGMPINIKPKFLVIPPELDYLASEILGSSLKPGVANNDINSLLKYGLQVMTVTYITSTSTWFAFAGKEDHKLKFFEREAFSTDYADDFDTGTLKMKSQQRFSCGASVWTGLWGSNGP